MPRGMDAQVLPPQAGFVSKAGAGAFIANNLLQGWLKGREIRAQREMQKAQTEVAGAEGVYKMASNNYQQVLMSGKDANSDEAKSAYQNLVTAYNQRIGTYQKYVAPAEPEKGTKKSVKQKVEGGFGQLFGKSGITPQLIGQAALQVAKSSPPPQGLTPENQLTMMQIQQAKKTGELTDQEIEQTKININNSKLDYNERLQATQDLDRWRKDYLAVQDGKSLDSPEKLWYDGYQQMNNAKLALTDPVRAAVNKAFLAYSQAQPINDQQRQMLVAQGLIKGPQLEITHQGNAEMLTVIDPSTGKIIGTPTKVGWTQDAASIAVAQMQGMHKAYVQEAIKAGMDPQAAEQAALLEESRNPQVIASFLGQNPVQQEKNQKLLSGAIMTVWNNAGGTGATAQSRAAEQKKMENFLTGDPKGKGGFMMFRDQIMPPEGTRGMWWWKQPEYRGGMSAAEAQEYRAKLYDDIREALHAQNPLLSATQLDAIMPLSLKDPQTAAPAGTQPGQPGQPAQPGQQMAAPPAADETSVGGTIGSGFWEMLGPGMEPAGVAGTVEGAVKAGTYLFTNRDKQQQQGQMAPGPDGVWGNQTPASRVYEVQTQEHGWAKTWLTPEQLEQLRQAGTPVRSIPGKAA